MITKEAIFIIRKCAVLCDVNLCDRQLALVYRDAQTKPDLLKIVL